MTDFELCGWRVRSEIALPELPELPTTDTAPDIHVSIGAIGDLTAEFPETIFSGRFLTLGRERKCLLTVPHIGRFLVENGASVRIAPEPQATESELRVFLLGAVVGYLAHQREELPLHAATIEVDGRAIAIAGTSGAGKSTLAAALVQRGHRLLGDDVMVVQWTDSDVPVARPACPRLKLWQDVLGPLNLDASQLIEQRRTQRRFGLIPEAPRTGRALPLHAILSLVTDTAGAAPALKPLFGFAAVELIGRVVYRRRIALQMGAERRLFAATTRLGRSTSEYRLARTDSLAHLQSLADLVESVA